MKRTFPNVFKILFALLISGWSSSVQAQYSGGDGTSGTPYEINSLGDLVYLSEHSTDWGLYFIQTADIVFPGPPYSGDGFLPVGDNVTIFTGSYDGQNHTISNLYINRSATDNVGLFGYSTGVIKNIGLLSVEITGRNNVGALGGTLLSSDNCYSTGNVSGNSHVGGLAGYFISSTICHSSCVVSGADNVGGFGGSNSGGVITQCYATGNASGTNLVGGFLGYSDAAALANCYSIGNVTGTGNSVGGLVGFNANSGSIQYSYSKGSVTGDSYVGGLAGGNDGVSFVQFCFSTGLVTGNTDKGGLVGWSGVVGNIESSFWDKGTSGMLLSAGGTGKTTAEMKRVGTYLDPGLYTPWDFTLAGNNWAFNGTDNNGYPFLRYETHTPADIWLGTVSTDWATTGNWSENAVPGSGNNIFIPDVLNNPSISSAGEMAGNITIEAGGFLSIATGGQLEVTGILNNIAGTAGFVINSGGSLKTNTSGVAATVKRDIPDALDNDRWHLFISPVTTPIQATATSCFNEAYLDRYNEPSGEWVRLLTNDYVSPENGYSINFMAGFKSLDFPGVLKSSPVVYSDLSFTSGAPGYLEGWNLVGNPYPCGINPELCSVPGGMNAFAYVWDGAAGNYTTLSIGSNVNPGTIASLQGFFVRTNSATNSLTLANAAKTHSGTFLKDANAVPEMLKLKISGNGYSDVAYIRFFNKASAGFDQEFDAYKMPGIDEAPQLYSIIPGEKATVNALPSIESNSDVAMGLKVGDEATYTLTISGIESFNAATPLFLEDLKTNTAQDLRQNAVYTFSAAPGDAEHRFNLHFTNTVGIAKVPVSKVVIYSNRHTVYIRNDENLKGKIEVYDLAGRLIRSSQLTGNQLDKVDIVNYKGNMLVKVITGKAITIEKVFVN